MALDPNISLGVRPLEIANPLTQYGQIAQLQSAQNQNQLAQYQLGAAQRQESTQNALSDAYKAAYNPQTGAIDNSLLMRGLAERGAGHLIPDVQTKMLATQKEQGLIKKTNVETTGLEFDQRIKKANKAISDIAALNSSEEAITSIDDHLAKGDIDQQKADMLKRQLAQSPSFDAWQNKMLTGILDAKGKLDQQKITTKDTDRGGYIERQTYDAQGRPVGLPTKLPKTATIGERTAQGQLSLAQQKFNFEQANPGYDLKEDADGNFFGVNKRTLQAVPVNIGGGAPAAAPAIQGAGMPGPRMAQPGVVQAIPGMTSVLDQPAPAAAPAAAPAVGGPRPLMGKGTALTESQGNATAYGMRMKEANSILNPLEKAGVKNTGLISGVVGSTLGVVPYLGDKLEGMSGSVFNALPQILGGLSPEQQQVAQARINFITAVLRKESGASISPSEFVTAEKNYFPKPGDDQTVVAQKQKARDLAIKSMGVQAGPGAKHIEQYVPSGGAAAPTVSNW